MTTDNLTTEKSFTFSFATTEDREIIYRLRYTVYASELGQHPVNEQAMLTDSLDAYNRYIVAKKGKEIVGFVSITPPGQERYSLDKYLPRTEWLYPVDNTLFEVRILTISPAYRNHPGLAATLLYAAFRVIEEQGGKNLIAIGRAEVLPLYQKAGLELQGKTFTSGAVRYELMGTSISALRQHIRTYEPMLKRLITRINWQLPYPFFAQPDEESCYHGGAFFQAIGEDFHDLSRRHRIINADVLDAWFPPSPRVFSALSEHLEWLLRTSPPTQCEGLRKTIATTRHVPPESLVVGAGSSDLMFRAFQKWLTPTSRVLLPDPTYGEYAHLLENVIGCTVERFPLSAENNFTLDLNAWSNTAQQNFDLVILVNPNNPTGQAIPRDSLVATLTAIPPTTRIWLDEAYTDYVSPDLTLEPLMAEYRNLFVCKSLSKVYALSGVRAAYLVAPPSVARSLRAVTPPWVIGLPAQVAAVAALQDPAYYAARYTETAAFRAHLQHTLQSSLPELLFFPTTANWLLAQLPSAYPTAAEIVRQCREHDVFLRDASTMGKTVGQHLLRIAVKEPANNEKIVATLQYVLHRNHA